MTMRWTLVALTTATVLLTGCHKQREQAQEIKKLRMRVSELEGRLQGLRTDRSDQGQKLHEDLAAARKTLEDNAIQIRRLTYENEQLQSALQRAKRQSNAAARPSTPKAAPEPAGPSVGSAQWDLPTEWSKATLEADRPMAAMCSDVWSFSRPHGAEPAVSYVGVAFGPAVDGKDAAAYKTFARRHRDAFLAAAKARKGFRRTNDLAQTIGTWSFDRVTAYYDDDHKATLLIGLHDGRPVAYWYDGEGVILNRIWTNLGQATWRPGVPAAPSAPRRRVSGGNDVLPMLPRSGVGGGLIP